jgi:hypothetical protein
MATEDESTITLYGRKDKVHNVPAQPPDYIYVAFILTDNDVERGQSGGDPMYRASPPASIRMKDGTGKRGFCGMFEMCMMRRTSPNFQHCQLVFAWKRNGDEPATKITFSTTKHDPSQWLALAFNDVRWYGIKITERTDVPFRKKLFNWSRLNQHTPFNAAGFYWNFLPCVPSFCAYDADGDAFFCAEQVSFALKYCGLPSFADAVHYTCTPDEVYARLIAGKNERMPLCLQFVSSSSDSCRFKQVASMNMAREAVTATAISASERMRMHTKQQQQLLLQREEPAAAAAAIEKKERERRAKEYVILASLAAAAQEEDEEEGADVSKRHKGKAPTTTEMQLLNTAKMSPGRTNKQQRR